MGIRRSLAAPSALGPFLVILNLELISISELVSAYLNTPDEYNLVMNKSSGNLKIFQLSYTLYRNYSAAT